MESLLTELRSLRFPDDPVYKRAATFFERLNANRDPIRQLHTLEMISDTIRKLQEYSKRIYPTIRVVDRSLMQTLFDKFQNIARLETRILVDLKQLVVQKERFEVRNKSDKSAGLGPGMNRAFVQAQVAGKAMQSLSRKVPGLYDPGMNLERAKTIPEILRWIARSIPALRKAAHSRDDIREEVVHIIHLLNMINLEMTAVTKYREYFQAIPSHQDFVSRLLRREGLPNVTEMITFFTQADQFLDRLPFYLQKAIESVNSITTKLPSMEILATEAGKLPGIATDVGKQITALSTTAGKLKNLPGEFDKLLGLTKIQTDLQITVDNLSKIPADIGTKVGAIPNAIGTSITTVKNSLDSLLKDVAGLIGNIFTSMKQTIITTSSNINKTLETAFNGIRDYVNSASESVKTGIGQSLSGITSYVNSTTDSVKTGIGSSISGITNSANTAVESVKSGIGRSISGIADSASTVVNNTTKALNDGFGVVGTTMSNLQTKLTDDLNSKINEVRGFVGSGVELVKGQVDSIFKSINTISGDISKELDRAFQNAMTVPGKMEAGLKDTWGTIGDITGNIVTSIQGAVDAGVGTAKKVIEKMISEVEKQIDDINGVASGIIRDVTGFASKVNDQLGPIMQNIGDMTEKIPKLMNSLDKMISVAPETIGKISGSMNYLIIGVAIVIVVFMFFMFRKK